mmetsp:Transcript_9229/g.17962  ORF Transcript_9229/g.17962 Transcript_9229/m.17962 type:complete len:260 (+) Transcript_9229:3-782(+)
MRKLFLCMCLAMAAMPQCSGMPSFLNCDSMTGPTVGGAYNVVPGSEAIKLKRGPTVLECGAEVNPTETLSIDFAPATGNFFWVFEVTDDASLSAGRAGCEHRSAGNDGQPTVTTPQGGSFAIRALYRMRGSGMGPVDRTANCTYTVAPPPTTKATLPETTAAEAFNCAQVMAWNQSAVAHCMLPHAWTDSALINPMESHPPTAWTGGLGRLMTGNVEVWVCMEGHPCAHNNERGGFCFVYHETERRFLPWAPNSCLGLV